MLSNDVIKALLFTPGFRGRWGLPLLLQGAPGTGKTSSLESIADWLGLGCEVIIASLREPADFLGLQIPTADGKLQCPAPPWAVRAANAERALVIFDEINTAPPAVQAALLRVVLEGQVGDLKLPNTVRFAAAMNSVEDAAGGWDLAPPLANRFGHFDWGSPDAEQWANFMLGGAKAHGDCIDAAAEEARVLEAFPNAYARATGVITTFLRRRPTLLHQQPKSGDPAASRAWASPRTWEMATRALAGADVHSLSELQRDEVLSAFIGTGPAGEFIHWLSNVDLPDPVAILDGKTKFEHDPARLDRTSAVLSACAALVAPTDAPDRNKRADVLWVILGEITAQAADIAANTATILCQPTVRLSTSKAAIPVLAKLKPVLDLAGIR